jgi:hypothetical protein
MRPQTAASMRDGDGVVSVRDAKERVTIIITTSPCRAHPSTWLIEEVAASIAGRSGLATGTGTRLLVVCDGYKVRESNKFRAGAVNEEGLKNYETYLSRLVWLSEQSDGALRGAELIRLKQRHGFGYALKRAMMRVTTEYVLVAQHDRLFTRVVPMSAVLDAMDADPQINYVGFPTKTTQNYDVKCVGRVFTSEYGQLRMSRKQFRDVELVPLVQHYDSMHVARTSFYLGRVFGQRRWTNLPVGGFIEDTVGQHMLAEFRKIGADAHSIFNMYIVEDAIDDEPMAGHLDGHDPAHAHEDAGAEFSFAHARSAERDWFERALRPSSTIETLLGTGHFSERKAYLTAIGRADLLPIPPTA